MVKMFGVIPAAGEGTRLRPITLTMPKHIVPLLGRPMIEYPISHLANSGINDIIIVVGYLGEILRRKLDNGLSVDVKLDYVFQGRRLGIAHAVYLAINEKNISGPMVVYLADNILKGGIEKYVKKFVEEEFDSYLLLSPVSDPSRFGVAILREGRVVRLVEKPKQFISNLAIVGIYFFRDPDLVQKAYSSLRPSWRGEYEITELIQWFIDNGYRVGYDLVEGWWKDIGTPKGLLDALYLLIDGVEPKVEGDVEGEVVGRVIVEKGALVEGKVYGPAYIGRKAYVGRDAKIEHYVSLESEASVISGFISRSLLLDKVSVDIKHLRLIDSVIGQNARISCRRDLYGTMRVALSEYSVVEL